MSLPDPASAVVSRIRIEASGRTVTALSLALHAAADRMVGINGTEYLAHGQEVYERQLNEPDDSVFAYNGRLILHPAIGLTGGPATTTKEQDG